MKTARDNYGLTMNFEKIKMVLRKSYIDVDEFCASFSHEIVADKHLPLSPDRYARLVHIRPKLMRMIHNNVDLIAALKSSSAISETDLDDLSADKGPNYKRNYRLINAILRRSDYSFECLHDALVSAHHQEAADYLDEGEVNTFF